jgi:hypothetical protein
MGKITNIFSSHHRSDSVTFRGELSALTDNGITFTAFHRRWTQLVTAIILTGDEISDSDLSSTLLQPHCVTNTCSAFPTYINRLRDAHKNDDNSYNWSNCLNDLLDLASRNPTIDNNRNTYVSGSRGIPTFAANIDQQCNRCARYNHSSSNCFASFCDKCHERIKGQHHDIRDPSICRINPDHTQEVYGLGLTPGARGSNPFTNPNQHQPYNRPTPNPSTNRPPLYFPRGGGRFGAAQRLRQNPTSTPAFRRQQPQTAYAASINETTTPAPPASPADNWTSDDQEQYDAYLEQHHDAFMASRDAAYNVANSQSDIEEESTEYANLAGVKRHHDQM